MNTDTPITDALVEQWRTGAAGPSDLYATVLKLERDRAALIADAQTVLARVAEYVAGDCKLHALAKATGALDATLAAVQS